MKRRHSFVSCRYHPCARVRLLTSRRPSELRDIPARSPVVWVFAVYSTFSSYVLLHEEPRPLDALRSSVAIGSDWRRHQTLFRNSHIFSGDWRIVYSAFSGSADCVAWPHRIDSAPLVDGGRAWLLVLSSRQIRRSVQIASLGHTKFISSICKSNKACCLRLLKRNNEYQSTGW